MTAHAASACALALAAWCAVGAGVLAGLGCYALGAVAGLAAALAGVESLGRWDLARSRRRA